MFQIGITGTRDKITDSQLNSTTKLLSYLIDIYGCDNLNLHHGDCVGADYVVATLATDFGISTVSHPPEKEGFRAFHKSTVVESARGYFERNRDIVNSSDILIVLPKENARQSRGGTWFTNDYAEKIGKKKIIFYPDGSKE